MIRTAPLRAWVLPALLSCLLPVSLAWCQDDSSPSDEDREEAKALIELAEPMLWRGSYFEAAKNLREATEADPTSERAAWLLGLTYQEQGEYTKALRVLEGLQESDAASILAGRVLIELGRLDEAETRLGTVLERSPKSAEALTWTGQILELRGKRDEAAVRYKEANTAWAGVEDEDTYEELMAVGHARLALFRLSDEFRVSLNSALARFDDARKLEDRRAHAFTAIGELYLRNYQDVDAKRQFKTAREKNRNFVPAIHGAGLQKAFRWDDKGAAEEWELVRRLNPRYLPSLLALAEIALGDADLDKARERIEEAHAVNPEDVEVRAAGAAVLYLSGDVEGFETAATAVLADVPTAGVVYRLLAGVLEEQRRFAEALVMAERAIEVDPVDWDAHFVAGRNAANVGDDEKAEKYLKRAEEEDIFHNLHRANFITVFDKLASFAAHRTDRFVVKLPPAEENAYLPLLARTLDWSLDLLQEKWSFEPETPVFISVFDRQEDFAVRTIGLPGFPALGACFGRVVTLDSPRTRPPGPFGWRATLHHELAHVITLQLSKGRVPRWLTEGISVYEERKVTPIWNREMERPLIDAIASDELLTLADINNAFRDSRVMFAYYQGGLMCEFIERDWGFADLREMVRLYGEGLDTPAVVRKALGVEPKEFDERFLAYAREYVAHIKVLPRLSRKKMARLKRHLRRNEGDLDSWLLLATGHVARGNGSDALSALARATDLPGGKDHPQVKALMALVAWQQKRPERAVAHAEAALAAGLELWELRMGLAKHYSASGKADFEAAKAHYAKAVELYPEDASPASARQRLAAMLLGEGTEALGAAMDLLRAHVQIAEDDFGGRLKLANYYRDQKRPAEELAMLEQIRDVVPLPFRPDAEGASPWGRRQAAEFNARLGRAYLATKAYGDAELALRMAAEVATMDTGSERDAQLPPEDRSDLFTQHAEALRLLGRVDEARERLREALVLDPENEEASELLESIDS